MVEVVLAIGLVAFVLVSILGLFGTGLKGVGESEAKIDAANVVTAILEQRFAAPEVPLAESPLPTLVWSNLPSSASNAITAAVTIDAGGNAAAQNARFKLRYRIWRDISASTNSRQVKVHLFLSWPADAPITSSVNQQDFLTSAFLEP